MKLHYDGLEGSSFRESFFYFSRNIFYFSSKFLAKIFSVSREAVFISCGTRGFGRPFREYVD